MWTPAPLKSPQTAVLAQQSFSEKIVFLLAGKASLPPLFTLAAGAVRSSRNRFFGDFVRQKRGLRASQRFPCQPVMTLLDNIGHLVRRCSIVSDWSHFSHNLLHWFKLQEFKKLDPTTLGVFWPLSFDPSHQKLLSYVSLLRTIPKTKRNVQNCLENFLKIVDLTLFSVVNL